MFSPCVTWNKINTYDYFRQKCAKFNGPDYDTSKPRSGACEIARNRAEDPIGLFYETQKPTYEEQDPALKFGNPVRAKLGVTDPNQLLQEFY